MHQIDHTELNARLSLIALFLWDVVQIIETSSIRRKYGGKESEISCVNKCPSRILNGSEPIHSDCRQVMSSGAIHPYGTNPLHRQPL